MRAYGRFVEGLNGRYLTAEDVGTTQADMDLIRRETAHVTGVSESLGGSGDPSPATAWGVLWAMKAVGERLWGTPSLAGRHVCISGVGKVGGALAHHLVDEGAKLTIADVRASSVDTVVERYGAATVTPAAAHTVPCDIFSPCALGAVLNSTTIPELRCEAVVGSANNQLASPADAERLRHRGIVYVPDFVANAGGVINIAEEPHGYDRDRAYDRIRTHPRHPAPGVRPGRRRRHHHRGGRRPARRGAHRVGQPHPPHPHGRRPVPQLTVAAAPEAAGRPESVQSSQTGASGRATVANVRRRGRRPRLRGGGRRRGGRRVAVPYRVPPARRGRRRP